MEYVIGIDPGKHHFAWSLFMRDKLIDCGLEFFKDNNYIDLLNSISLGIHSITYIEKPQIYKDMKEKNPNDLIDVGIAIGRIYEQIIDLTDIKLVLPHDWKGSVPKNIMLKRIKKQLNKTEEKLFKEKTKNIKRSLQHNIIDAIGIGLFFIKRL